MSGRMIIFLFGISFFGVQCSGPEGAENSADSSIHQDDLGREIYVTSEPHRMLSLAPSTTEVLFEIYPSDWIVGVTHNCDYPDEVSTKARVTNFPLLDVESIVSLQPDLIVTMENMTKPQDVQRLADLGFNVYVMKFEDPKSMARSVRKLAEVLGVKHKADKSIARMETLLVEEKNLPPLSYLAFVSLDPMYVHGDRSFLGGLLRYANWENVVVREKKYPLLSREELLELNPEAIIVSQVQRDSATLGALYPEFFRASQERAFVWVELDSDLSTRPTFRAVEIIEQLKSQIQDAE